MPLLQKKQILNLIRDVLVVYVFYYTTTNHLIDISNTQFRYTIIIAITLSLIYCIFKCFSALIIIILRLITINNYFLSHSRNAQYSKLIPVAILSFFIYLYLISLNIKALEIFNKIDFYLLVFKAITF
jgi:hypothetical protein